MTTTQTMPVIASGGYVLDPTASEVAITARGAFGARVQASIDLVDVQVDVAADPSASRAQATFDMSSFQSGNGRRDKDIRNRFFRADENPTMTFTSTRLQVGADGGWELAGRLEYRAACDDHPGAVRAGGGRAWNPRSRHGNRRPLCVRSHQGSRSGLALG